MYVNSSFLHRSIALYLVSLACNVSTDLRSAESFSTDILFNNYTLISSDYGSENKDHIWHHDGSAGGAGGTWHFVSDSTYKATGNARLQAGHIHMVNTSSKNYLGSDLGIRTTSPAGFLDVANSFYARHGHLLIRPQNTSTEGGEIHLLGAGSYNRWTLDTYAGRMRMHHDGISYFDMASNGNLGLGTHTPNYRLDVNGTVRAKEIIVESNWSDFVFEDGYEFPTLEEVEAHIEEKGHLPGVPSAEEIHKEGLPIGEAQTFMMQKIEELTLYVLQLNAANTELKEDSKELRQRLRQLEAELISR